MLRVSVADRRGFCRARTLTCFRTTPGKSQPRIRFRRDWIIPRSAPSTLGCTTQAGLNMFRLRRSEEHTSELQSHSDLVCRLLLEKKKNKHKTARKTLLPSA